MNNSGTGAGAGQMEIGTRCSITALSCVPNSFIIRLLLDTFPHDESVKSSGYVCSIPSVLSLSHQNSYSYID